MSFGSMAKSLAQGEIPGVSISFAKNSLNEALTKIYQETDWSFQTQQSGWYVKGLFASVGTVTVTPYSTEVIGDADATAAWNSSTGRPWITEQQFRDPSYALYNIVAYDDGTTVGQGNFPFATLTLDRPWAEPTSGAGRPYQIYQAYFPVPVQDFTKFIEIRDTTYNAFVSFSALSQNDLSVIDPKRLMFGPAVLEYAVPWGIDQRPGSATLGYIMYELWPHVLATVPYSFSYKRQGPPLVNPDDTAPYPITEELIKWRTKEVIYQFKEAQRGEELARGSGANWGFLAQSAAAEYKEVLKKVRALDANLHRDFVTRQRTQTPFSRDGYSTPRTGNLNLGWFDRGI